MKTTYFVASEYMKDKDGKNKYFAAVITVPPDTNLLSVLNQYDNLITIVACSSQKEASQIAYEWNQGYKAIGNNLY